MDADSIKEKANSADENITFTDDACEALTQVQILQWIWPLITWLKLQKIRVLIQLILLS